jgi:hypothetical protein
MAARARLVPRTLPVTDVISPPSISAAAERMRLHRHRRRNGLRCLNVELRETEIDTLIRKGLLKQETRNDPYAVREALYAHLDNTLP